VKNVNGSAKSAAGRLAGVEYLTVAEVAEIMRVSKMTVYRLVHTGELDSIRVGRSLRLPAASVLAYLKLEPAPGA